MIYLLYTRDLNVGTWVHNKGVCLYFEIIFFNSALNSLKV